MFAVRIVPVLLLLASSAYAQKEFGFDNRKGSGQPYLKPEETVSRMKAADGFEVKLFAGEPQLVNPIAMTVDEKGRVWVVECFEYPKRTAKGKMPRDRVKILEDTDGDGVCDKVTTFIEGKDFPVPFDMASGIEVGNGGVYLGAPPYLFFIENKNDKPGKIETLLQGFGSHDTHETLNTFQWGPDGWLYGLHGVFTHSDVRPAQADGPAVRMNAAVWRFHPKTKKFEVFSEGTSNPWGMDYRNTDGQFILACCVIPHLFHMVPGGIYKRQAGQSFNPYAYGEIKEICDHTFHKESGWAHAGLISLDTPLMPEKWRNSVVFGSIHGCSIKQNILKPNGSSYIASRGDDFLVSGDKNFRPINLRWGPNGEIYCIDWHDQNPCHQTKPDDWDYERGRVYRIQTTGLKTTKSQDLGTKDATQLGGLLKDNNPYIARTAARLLRERFADSPTTFGSGPKPKTGNEAQDIRPTGDHATAWQVRGIAQKQNITPQDIRDLMAILDHGASAVVRREIASAAIRLQPTHDVRDLLHALMAVKEDATDPIIPQLVWTAYEPILIKSSADEAKWLQSQPAGNPFLANVIVPRTIRRLVATGKPEDVNACIDFIGGTTDAAVRVKALDSLVSAIGNRTIDEPKSWGTVRDKLTNDSNVDVKRLTNSLAVKFADRRAIARALSIAQNPIESIDYRLSAIRDLGVAKSLSTLEPLVEIVRGKEEALKAEAIRALGGFDSPAVAKMLLQSWPKLSPVLRNESVNVLAGRKDWATELVAAIRSKAVDRAELTDNTILRIQALKDNKLNADIEAVWGRFRATPAELNQLIDKMRGELAAAPGSFERGRVVFENQCAKCHKFDGKGHEVGPNIEGAGRDIEYLLANVLDPNRVIGAPYFMRTVNLLSGRVETGVLHAEDGQSLTLKTENAVLKQIQRKDIDEVRVQEKSLMPEGLGNNMTVQNFRDLVRYTMANPFIANVEIRASRPGRSEEQKPLVGVNGRIPLPDGDWHQVAVTATVFVPEDMRIRVLVGSRFDYRISTQTAQPNADGLSSISSADGKGSGVAAQPDQSSVEVRLIKGENKLTFTTRYDSKGESAYVRVHDPDRKLRYVDPK